MDNWKLIMAELKHKHLKEEAPSFYAASGGRTMKVKSYDDKSTNGLTNAIMDWLKFHNHYATRINCIGIVRNIGGVAKYTPSSTRRGVADIHSLILGKHVSIEIKCKATNDKMSTDQHKEQKRIESSGGIYYVAQTMPSFLEWFNKTFNTHNNKL